jgi:hypothetical protein
MTEAIVTSPLEIQTVPVLWTATNVDPRHPMSLWQLRRVHLLRLCPQWLDQHCLASTRLAVHVSGLTLLAAHLE